MFWGIVYICTTVFITVVHMRASNKAWDRDEASAKRIGDLMACYILGAIALFAYHLNGNYVAFVLWCIYAVARLRREIRKSGP